MTTPATYDDANLILRLYEMRREEKLREARAWFVRNFYCESVDEYQKIAPPGTQENAYARQVITYWEMAASLVASGVLNETLFFQSNQEMLVVWTRVRKMLPDLRAAYRNQALWKNLELVAQHYIEHMNRIEPLAFDAFAARVSPGKK
jgi:hypothetical protein